MKEKGTDPTGVNETGVNGTEIDAITSDKGAVTEDYDLFTDVDIFTSVADLKCKVTVVEAGSVKLTPTSRVYNALLQDSVGQKIRIVAWKDEADLLYDMFKEQETYIIKAVMVKKITWPPAMDYGPLQLVFVPSSSVEKAVEKMETVEIYRFLPSIKKIKNLKEGTKVDVIGVVSHVFDPEVKIAGKRMQKKILSRFSIFDKESRIDVVSWTLPQEDTWNLKRRDVIILEKSRITNYNGKQLSGGRLVTVSRHNMFVEFKEWVLNHKDLKTLYDPLPTLTDPSLSKHSAKHNWDSAKSMTLLKLSDQLQLADSMNKSPEPNFCKIKATFEDLLTGDCIYAEQATQNPKWRLKVNITDDGVYLRATIWDQKAQELLGMSAQDGVTLRNDDPDAFKELVMTKLQTLEDKIWSVYITNNQFNNKSNHQLTVHNIE